MTTEDRIVHAHARGRRTDLGVRSDHRRASIGRRLRPQSVVAIAVSLCAATLPLVLGALSAPARAETQGNITTIAGNGTAGYSGDGGPATAAQLDAPEGVAADSAGNVYIADWLTDTVRKVATDGIITTVAGTGVGGYSGDGGPATAAKLLQPLDVVVDPAGNLYISDQGNNCIRKVTASTGVITRFAGACGTSGFDGDGGPATAAHLNYPYGLAIDGGGNVYFSDHANYRIRKVATNGTITTVVGNGIPGNTGDGGSATSASINQVRGVGVIASGELLVADTGNHRVRKVAGGIITNFAGTGVAGFSGDGGQATAARLDGPLFVRAAPDGAVFVTDSSNNRVRRVGADGVITTITGTGVAGFSGDGGPATLAKLNYPRGLALDNSGNLFIGDTLGNHRVREVFGAAAAAPLTGGDVTPAEVRGGHSPSEPNCVCAVRDVTQYPVSTMNGNFWHTFPDLTVPGRGPALDLSHTYNSAAASTDGPLGFGWTHSYNISLTVDAGSVTVNEEGGSQVVFTQSGSNYTAPPRVAATLVHNGDGTWTLTRRARSIYVFDSTGRLTAQKDLNGHTTAVTYPSASSMVATDPASRTLTFTYTGTRVTSVSDSSTPARTVVFAYNDGAGNLTDVTDVGGGNWHFTYDAAHRMLTMRDPRLGVVTNHYDGSGRVDWQSDPLGRTTSFDYTSVLSSTKVTDPKGNVTLDTYQHGVLTSQTKGYGSPQAAIWAFTYDPDTLGLVAVRDPNGHVTTATYDGRGNKLTQKDPLNRTTTWTYNALNQPLTVTDPLNVTTTMTYDAAGNLLTRSRPLTGTAQTQQTTYTYGDPGHPGDVTSTTDPNGNAWAFGHDGFGNLTSTQAPATPENPAGNKTTYGYDTAKGWRTSMVSPKGNVTGANPADFTTTYEHDAFGHVTKVKDPLWNAATPTQHQHVYRFDPNGNLDSETDGNNNTTTYTYNAANELTVTTRPDGTTLSTTYDKAGNVVVQKDGAGFATTYGYDALNRRTGTAAYQGAVRTDDPVAWWRQGEPSGTTMTDASGNGRNGTYNTAGVTYGIAGAVPADADTAVSFNGTTGYASVPDNNVFSPQVGTSGAISVEAWVKLTSLPPAGGEDRAAIVTKSANSNYEYGLYAYSDGRVGFQLWRSAGTTHSLAVGGSIPLNQWVHVAGTYKNGVATKAYLNGTEVGSSTTFSGSTTNGTGSVSIGRRHNGQYLPGSVDEPAIYNVALTPDRVTKHFHGGRGTSYAYDGAGNRTSLADPAGQTTTFGYDAADQLKTVTYSDGTTPNVTNVGYDAAGRRTAMTDGTGTSTWTWDSLDRLTSSTNGAGATVGYGYDLEEHVTSLTYPGGVSVTRHFDAAGRMDWVEDWAGNRTTFAYDADSNPVTRTLPAATNVVDSFTFDNADRLTAVNVNRLLVPLASFTYGRDGNDQLSSVASTGVPLDNHSYTYTSLNQLKNVDVNQYGYDAADNLTQLTSGGRQGFDRLNRICWSTTTPPTGTPTCRVPPSGATTYDYDSRGNRTSVTTSGGSTTAMAWDQSNLLKTYGTTAAYVSNGDGLRASKTVSGATTAFTYDLSGSLPSLLQETTGATTTRYIYGPDDKVIESVSGTTTTYHHQDQLGSTRVLTDSTGTVTGTFTYDSYGQQTGSTGTASTPFGWAGEYRDVESGLIYLRARYYDPATAQFLSVDPLYAETGSRYGYVDANPLNAVDPFGLYSYSYSYNIGDYGPYGARGVMSAMQADPSAFFPFPIEGARGETRLQRGHTYDLRPLPGPHVDTVRVTAMTVTSFTFRTLPGHAEGYPATIRFSTRVDKHGDTIFTVCARGPDGNLGRILNPVRRGLARRFWGNMAKNIEDYGFWASGVA